jgi:hypothetical protein
VEKLDPTRLDRPGVAGEPIHGGFSLGNEHHQRSERDNTQVEIDARLEGKSAP